MVYSVWCIVYLWFWVLPEIIQPFPVAGIANIHVVGSTIVVLTPVQAQYSIVKYSTVQYSNVQYSKVEYSTGK
jgi:hypothetical protein